MNTQDEPFSVEPIFETPNPITNRQGLPQVRYRVGTHSAFKRTLIKNLAMTLSGFKGSQLKTQDDSDLTIALLDGWATIADILTFYQERIIQESYLRTATERFSLVEMAHLIGYALDPGVAAKTYLAFTVEDAEGSPQEVSIEKGIKVQSIPGPDQIAQIFETQELFMAKASLNLLRPQMTEPFPDLKKNYNKLCIQGTQTQLKPGDFILFLVNGEPQDPIALTKVEFRFEDQQTWIFWGEEKTFNDKKIEIVALRKQAFIWEYIKDLDKKTLYLDRVYSDLSTGSWLALTSKTATNAFQVVQALPVLKEVLDDEEKLKFQVRISEVALASEINTEPFSLKDTAVLLETERLNIAEQPIETPISGDNIPLDTNLEGFLPEQRMILCGEETETGTPMSEIVYLSSANENTIFFKSDLSTSYRRESVKLFGNIARATHGETVQEILGSGYASRVFQTFTLSHQPITYLTAPTTRGNRSTLQVYVDDLLWEEVPTLYNQEKDAHVYITRIGDHGKATIQFGDGRFGARLPTGTNNIRVIYRKGSGLGGKLKANQLTQLLSHPLGVKGVTNPLPTTGGDDPETIEDVRAHAPLTVSHLERVVSLSDYRDFCLTYSGVEKAYVCKVWDGEAFQLFITLAGPQEEPFQGKANLTQALKKFGDPKVTFELKDFEKVPITIEAQVKVKSNYNGDKVIKEVEKTLKSSFDFSHRSLGESISFSEVIAMFHLNDGVEAVEINVWKRDSSKTDVEDVIVAKKVGEKGGAEILLFGDLKIEEMK